MIRIACTNCKTILLIDDAFAGGVCRCQHCGTIQTVPAKAKQGNGVASGQAIGGSKAFFQKEGRGDAGVGSGLAPSGTGLDELAGIVASSGLAGSGLSSRRLTRPNIAPQPRKRFTPLLITATAAAVLILGLVAVILWLALRPPAIPANPGVATGGSTNISSEQPAPTPAPNQPAFCGVPIDASSVVYLLDRGSGSKEIFPALEDATLKSLQSLGPNRRFQVLFWANGSDDAGYPPASTTYATAENIEAARRTIDGVAVFGASDVKSALQQALQSHPDLIVIVTPKGWQLDANWANDQLALRGANPVRIDTFSLGTGGDSDGLKLLASKTAGRFEQITDAQLRAAGG